MEHLAWNTAVRRGHNTSSSHRHNPTAFTAMNVFTKCAALLLLLAAQLDSAASQGHDHTGHADHPCQCEAEEQGWNIACSDKTAMLVSGQLHGRLAGALRRTSSSWPRPAAATVWRRVPSLPTAPVPTSPQAPERAPRSTPASLGQRDCPSHVVGRRRCRRSPVSVRSIVRARPWVAGMSCARLRAACLVLTLAS